MNERLLFWGIYIYILIVLVGLGFLGVSWGLVLNSG